MFSYATESEIILLDLPDKPYHPKSSVFLGNLLGRQNQCCAATEVIGLMSSLGFIILNTS